MQAHTRKHRTKDTEKFIAEEDTPMSADDMILKISGNLPEWAVVLRGLRYREGLTQAAMGNIIGIPQGNISQMERGKRPIGKQIAKKLADFFHTDYHLFL
jgi:DNA-binding XRE family transcriptional regulator